MSRKSLTVLLALLILLTAVVPASAGSAPAKAYCKGSYHEGLGVELNWDVLNYLVPASATLEGEIIPAHYEPFRNQGQCISHVNHTGGAHVLCAYLAFNSDLGYKCPNPEQTVSFWISF